MAEPQNKQEAWEMLVASLNWLEHFGENPQPEDGRIEGTTATVYCKNEDQWDFQVHLGSEFSK